MKKNTSHKGFTLIELLVVVAIIGLLAATILASLGSARSKARAARAQSEISSMRAAAELYYSEYGSYDDSDQDLWTDPQSGMENLVASVREAAGGTVSEIADVDNWAFSAVVGGTSYCADSNGYSGKGKATADGCEIPQ